jgi:glycine/D-amino acid oxidase-like deaminating enzyme
MQSNILWPVTERFPKLSGDHVADVVVIGGGITGISSAYNLQKAGHKVILIEKDEIGSGATGASSGNLCYGSGTNFIPATELFGKENAVSMWKDTSGTLDEIVNIVSEYKIDCGLKVPGGIMIAKTAEEAEELRAEHEALKEIGFETKLLSPEELKQFYPLVPFLLGMSFDHCAQIHPGRFVAGLAKAANLEVFENSKMTDWKETDDGIIVQTKEGKITCKKIVFATNTEDYFDLKKHFGIESSVVIASQLLENIRTIWPQDKIMWFMDERYDMIYPEEGRVILELYQFKDVEKKSNFYFPNTGFKMQESWGDIWSKTKDWLPIVSQIRQNVIVAIAVGDQGIIMGWLSGRNVLNLVEGRDNWFTKIASHKRFD